MRVQAVSLVSCWRVAAVTCSLRIGQGMRAELVRDEVVVAQCHPQEPTKFKAKPEAYNFNAFTLAASE